MLPRAADHRDSTTPASAAHSSRFSRDLARRDAPATRRWVARWRSPEALPNQPEATRGAIISLQRFVQPTLTRIVVWVRSGVPAYRSARANRKHRVARACVQFTAIGCLCYAVLRRSTLSLKIRRTRYLRHRFCKLMFSVQCVEGSECQNTESVVWVVDSSLSNYCVYYTVCAHPRCALCDSDVNCFREETVNSRLSILLRFMHIASRSEILCFKGGLLC